MPDASHTPPALQHTLHGDDLSWLHLILDGVLPSRYAIPAMVVGQTADRTDSPDQSGSLAATLTVPDAAVGDRIDLLDPEGVTLASLTVTDVHGDTVGGPVEKRSGFTIVDHLDLRVSRDEAKAAAGGPMWALWVDGPVSFALREAVRTSARAHGARVVEIVPVPTGHETSRAANAPVRLARAHTTRDAVDRVIVVPFPGQVDGALRHQLQLHVAAAYGASEVVAAAPTLSEPPLSGEGSPPVRLIDVDAEQQRISADDLDAWVLARTPLPAWAAEPAVAEVLAKVHRPTSRTGLTVLLSGLSGSGKSTVARALAVKLVGQESRSVSLLDGDVVRHHLSKGLGFSRPDRITNVLRIGFVASEITKAGGIAVCCPIAPYDATRKEVRAMVEEHGSFVLVHVATPLAECERRDRKGLYAKARSGEIPEFTGISDPYEEPADAEVVIDTTGRTIEACVDEVYQALVARGVVQ